MRVLVENRWEGGGHLAHSEVRHSRDSGEETNEDVSI